MTTRLELSDVSVTYPGQPQPTVKGCSFGFSGGKLIGILGDNGSGKTTLAQAICGIIPHLIRGRVAGRIEFDERDLAQLTVDERFALVGYTFQDTESQILFGTVRDVLGGARDPGSDRFFERALEILDVRHLLDRRPDELSGGEAQRVVLLGALRTNPSVLIYDEATSALDPQARRDFGQFAELLISKGIVTLLLGQRLAVLSRWCGEVIRLVQGRPAALEGAGSSSRTNMNVFWEELRTTAPRAELSVLGLTGVQVRGLQRTKPRLAGIEFRVSPGERVALVGPNGAGKTTLLLAIIGRLRASAGTFEWQGKQFTSRQWRRSAPAIALVSQSPHQRIIGSTIGEEFEMALGPTRAACDANLWPLLHRWFPYLQPEIDPFQLSYGQQRWLTTLTALLGGSSIILLDEPEQGLDTRTLEYLETWLKNDSNQRGKSVLFSTHDLEFAANYADRCVLLRDGQILAETSLHEPHALESWYFSQVSRVR